MTEESPFVELSLLSLVVSMENILGLRKKKIEVLFFDKVNNQWVPSGLQIFADIATGKFNIGK
jgi:hypothetical protein